MKLAPNNANSGRPKVRISAQSASEGQKVHLMVSAKNEAKRLLSRPRDIQ
jgi:hypothetical protein